MKNLINKISAIADKFSVTKDRKEQRQLMESFIETAQIAIAHPDCSPDYRSWLRGMLPVFKSDLNRIKEIDMKYDN